jgi:hypothetical protein
MSHALEYLGESIKLLAKADIAYFASGWNDARGCCIEHECAEKYGINKVTDLPIFSYKNKLGGWNVVKNLMILLPIKDGKIDLQFMDTFISATQKQAIQDVVQFADREMAATKAIILSPKTRA